MYNPEQEQLIRKQKLNTISTEAQAGMQMDHMYASTMQRQQERTEALQESRFKLGGVSYKDGKEMTEVKRYQGMITEAMKGPVPKDRKSFDYIVSFFEKAYQELIHACYSYIFHHKHPITSSGKARLSLVRGTLGLAEQEAAKFKEKADELFELNAKMDGELIWGNILGEIRGSDFDLDQMDNLQTGGAAISEVLIMTINKQKFFFKAEEKIDTPEQAFEKQYLQNCTEEKDQQIYKELKMYMETNVFGGKAMLSALGMGPEIIPALKAAKTEQELRKPCLQFLNILRTQYRIKTNLDYTDIHTLQIMKDVLIHYELWLNRMDVCERTKIDAGESLSKRNVLTTRMAAVLHGQELVAHSNLATVHHSGLEKKEGIVMANAKGEEFQKVINAAKEDEKKIVYTPEAVRQLSCLQLMDTICGQTDRHYSNRFVTTTVQGDKVIITGVQGIDHDLSFGKLLYEDVKDSMWGSHLPAFENENNLCSIPALDEAMVSHLRAITKGDLEYYLGDLLAAEYIDAMWNRVQGVLDVIDRTLEKSPDLLVKKDEWNLDVAKKFVASKENNLYIHDAKPEDFVEEPIQKEKQK